MLYKGERFAMRMRTAAEGSSAPFAAGRLISVLICFSALCAVSTGQSQPDKSAQPAPLIALAETARSYRQGLAGLKLREVIHRIRYDPSRKQVADEEGVFLYSLCAVPEQSGELTECRRKISGTDVSASGFFMRGVPLLTRIFDAEVQQGSQFKFQPAPGKAGFFQVDFEPKKQMPLTVEGRLSDLHASGGMAGSFVVDLRTYAFDRLDAHMLGLPASTRYLLFRKFTLEVLRFDMTFQELKLPGRSEAIQAPREINVEVFSSEGEVVLHYAYSPASSEP